MIMYQLFPDKEINHRKIKIVRENGSSFSALVLSPQSPVLNAPGILWIHGGGYMLGMIIWTRNLPQIIMEKYGIQEKITWPGNCICVKMQSIWYHLMQRLPGK